MNGNIHSMDNKNIYKNTLINTVNTRNSKKLFLHLNDNNIIENTNSDRAKPALLTRKSESFLYSLPKKTEVVSTRISGLAEHTNNSVFETSYITPTKSNIKRGDSLSLSVNTNSTQRLNNKEFPSNNVYLRNRSQTLTPTTAFPSNDLFANNQFLINDRKQNNELDGIESTKEVYEKFAYPNGPMLVVPPYIYLYSEPTLNELFEFEIVINVAKEIPNLGESIPNDFKLAYYQYPWSHNSKIFSDLENITDIIYEGFKNKQKILIHCQCGISRSASLIVAYIMRFHHLSLNEAYDALKNVATDISPNMNLIFQLMEWNDFLNNNNLKNTNINTSFDTHRGVSMDINSKLKEKGSVIQSEPTVLSPYSTPHPSEVTPPVPNIQI